MAKEATVKKHALAELKAEGFYCWCPAKVKYAETDIFGVYDCIAVKGEHVRYIQWTTRSNVSARVRKVQAFLNASGARIKGEVWGLRDDKTFRKVAVEYGI